MPLVEVRKNLVGDAGGDGYGVLENRGVCLVLGFEHFTKAAAQRAQRSQNFALRRGGGFSDAFFLAGGKGFFLGGVHFLFAKRGNFLLRLGFLGFFLDFLFRFLDDVEGKVEEKFSYFGHRRGVLGATHG